MLIDNIVCVLFFLYKLQFSLPPCAKSTRKIHVDVPYHPARLLSCLRYRLWLKRLMLPVTTLWNKLKVIRLSLHQQCQPLCQFGNAGIRIRIRIRNTTEIQLRMQYNKSCYSWNMGFGKLFGIWVVCFHVYRVQKYYLENWLKVPTVKVLFTEKCPL